MKRFAELKRLDPISAKTCAPGWSGAATQSSFLTNIAYFAANFEDNELANEKISGSAIALEPTGIRTVDSPPRAVGSLQRAFTEEVPWSFCSCKLPANLYI
jgi:hypothetical protein